MWKCNCYRFGYNERRVCVNDSSPWKLGYLRQIQRYGVSEKTQKISVYFEILRL